MRCSSLVSSRIPMVLVALMMFVARTDARASDGDTGAPDPEVDAPPVEEIVVFGDLEIARKKSLVVRNLRALGYRERRTDNGRTVYRPQIPYRPSVLLDDDGWMVMRRTPVRIDPPGNRDNKLRYLWCLPPFTITRACIQTGGQLISQRKLQHFKEDVARATRYEITEWRDAVVRHAMDKRLNVDIPDMLVELWTRGLPMGDEGPFLESADQRRRAIFDFWSSRACTPEGEQARAVVADFVHLEIQISESPADAIEIDATNATQRCPDTPRL